MTKVYTTQALAAALNSFTIIQPSFGTSPVADSPTDTLNLTSSDGSILILGNSATDTIDFTLDSIAIQSLQGVYSNSPTQPQIVLNSTNKGLFIYDAATPIALDLFKVAINGGATSYFKVNSTGFSGTRMDVDNIRIDADTISNTTSTLNIDVIADTNVAIANVTGTPVLTILNTTATTKKVGLNVAAPTQLFEAINTTGTRASFIFRCLDSTTTASFILEDQLANQFAMTFSNAANFFWRYNNTALMRMSTTGQLRIQNSSTVAPTARLHVVEDTPAAEVVRIETVTPGLDPNYVCFQNLVTTTDATPTTVLSLPITTTRTAQIYARVTARRTGGTGGTAGDGAGYEIYGTYKNIAGTITIIGAVNQIYVAEDQAGWNATLVINGTNVDVQITGALLNNISWHCTSWKSET